MSPNTKTFILGVTSSMVAGFLVYMILKDKKGAI